MLAEERWQAILDLLEREKSVTVTELTERLHTSESTIRRDLTQLAGMRKLNKVHGGATLITTRYVLLDQTMKEKQSLHAPEKQRIGAYAAALIRDDDFVYIDAGSTTARLVEAVESSAAVFVTNSIAHARRLLAKGCRVLLPGGTLKATTEVLVGAETVEALRRYHFTIGFWGANGVSDRNGFTTPETEEAMVKQVSMEQTERKYVIADGSKFSQVSPVTFAPFRSAQIITNRLTDPAYARYRNITEVEK